MDDDFNDFIEVGKKNSNSWWKSLDSVQDVFKTHLKMFDVNAKHFFATGQSNPLNTTATVKTCPAIGNGLLDKIILLKLPCDVFISVNEKGVLYWNINAPSKLKIESHPTSQFSSSTNNPFENKVNIKFKLPIVLDFSGDTYMFLQPQYHKQNYPLQVINGSSSKRRINASINTFIDIPKETQSYHLKEGTILSYLWLDNNKIKLSKNKNLTEKFPSKFFGNS